MTLPLRSHKKGSTLRILQAQVICTAAVQSQLQGPVFVAWPRRMFPPIESTVLIHAIASLAPTGLSDSALITELRVSKLLLMLLACSDEQATLYKHTVSACSCS